MKKYLIWLICLCFMCTCLPSHVHAASSDAFVRAMDLPGYNNTSSNYYTTWSKEKYSSIYENSDGSYTVVRTNQLNSYYGTTDADGLVYVDTFTDSGEVLSHKEIPMELHLYGGFFHGEKYNFIVYGQLNREESNEKEVLRVVKYSHDWQRLDAVSINNINTTVPFDAGTLSMDETDGHLYIHTCHEMYMSSDGLNHQANMSFKINKEEMTVIQSSTKVSNRSTGYVSHSFNQFIKTDGNDVYRVDHGDAYPRSIFLSKASDDKTLYPDNYGSVYSIPGTIGENATGLSIGGFELSDTSCIIAGNTIDHDNYPTYYTGNRNIFLIIASRDFSTAKKVMLTSYPIDGEINACTPELVKINNDKYLVVWYEMDLSYNKTTKVVLVDGEGNKLTDIHTLDMRLSDCQPIVNSKGNVVWTYHTGSKLILCSINPNVEALSDYKCEHDWIKATCTTPKMCTLCGLTEGNYLGHSYVSKFVSYKGATCTEDGLLEYEWRCERCDRYLYTDSEIMPATGHTIQTTKENEKQPTCSTQGSYEEVQRCTRCNEELSREIVTIPTIDHRIVKEKVNDKQPTCTTSGSYDIVESCSMCNKEISRETIEVPATGHTIQTTRENEKKATCTASGSYDSVKRCTTCNEEVSRKTVTIPVTGHLYASTTTEATFDQAGKTEEACKYCGEVKSTTTISQVTSAKLSTTAYTYNGSKKTPSVTVKDSKGKTLVKDTDYTVTYASGRTSIGRYKVTVTLKGKYSGSKNLYFTVGPKNPTTVKAVLYGYDDVQVTWSKVSGASGYKVYYRVSGTSTWSSKTTTGTSMKLANLSAGKKYEVKVVTYKTVSGNKCYNGGKTTTVTTLKKVTGVKATTSGSSVKVSWSNIAGESGYQISKSTSSTGTSIVATYATTTGSSKTVSATKGKTYYYKVRAYKTVGSKKIYGPWSSAVKYVRK